MNMDLFIHSSNELIGSLAVPGDKSISHRALIFGCLANGNTIIDNLLESTDVMHTLHALQTLGFRIDKDFIKGSTHSWVVNNSSACDNINYTEQPIYLGNSGTSMRLLAGFCVAKNIDAQLIGDDSLMSRPMMRIVKPLSLMGANIHCSELGTAPLQIKTTSKILRGIDYVMPVISAQVKSCLLIAGLFATGITKIREKILTRNHTENLLTKMSAKLICENNTVTLFPVANLQSCHIQVPGDFSTASFFIVAALIAQQSNIKLVNVNLNDTRTYFLRILQRMGANICIDFDQEHDYEKSGDIHIAGRQNLSGTIVTAEEVTKIIDEFPICCIAAACAQGTTKIYCCSELKLKESNRIQAMKEGLINLGIKVYEENNYLVIQGQSSIHGGQVNSYVDHRIAMSFAILGLVTKQPIHILDCNNISTSYPNFINDAIKLGLNIEKKLYDEK